jgi:RNA polymerase sigma-70 factor (ECF subfamily)
MLSACQVDFAGVASRYSRVLFCIALRKLRNVEDAEDAVQDAFLCAYRHLDQFQGRSKLSSWLTSIVVNSARMKLRSRERREIVSLDEAPEDGNTTFADNLMDSGPNPETICSQTETRELLRNALSQISPKLGLALHMREIGGLSTRETAEGLNINVSAVKSRVKRARTAVGLYFDKVKRDPSEKGVLGDKRSYRA